MYVGIEVEYKTQIEPCLIDSVLHDISVNLCNQRHEVSHGSGSWRAQQLQLKLCSRMDWSQTFLIWDMWSHFLKNHRLVLLNLRCWRKDVCYEPNKKIHQGPSKKEDIVEWFHQVKYMFFLVDWGVILLFGLLF